MPLPGLPTGAAARADEELWRLAKGRRVAVCFQQRHPHGFALRVEVNADTVRSTVVETAEDAQHESTRMFQLMLERGWRTVPQS